MSAPTVVSIAKRLLRDIGVVSLDPDSPADQIVPIESTDLDDIAMVMTAGMQESWAAAPAEVKQLSGGAYLYAPTAVTLTATLGSATISALTTYASWMIGCTIRIAGDEADNEIVSSTALARPYTGASGSSKAATVYCDAIVFDETVESILPPVFAAGRGAIPMASGPAEFFRLGQWTGLADIHGVAIEAVASIGLFTQKTTGPFPYAWILDGMYDASLSYSRRRMRFTPMPTAAQSISFTKLLNPIRITAANIVAESVTVSGATGGFTGANGTYTAQGTLNGAALYVKIGDAASNTYFLWLGTTAWTLQAGTYFPDDGSSLYFLDTTSPSPAGSYSNGDGTGAVVVALNSIVLPMPNEFVESIYLPICRQIMTALGNFKNEAGKPEIARAYKKALDIMINATAAKGDIIARYPA